MALKWEEPGPVTNGGHRPRAFTREVNELIANPGKWALLAIIKDKPTAKTTTSQRAASMAGNIRELKYAAFADAVEKHGGAFETASRSGKVHVRYVSA